LKDVLKRVCSNVQAFRDEIASLQNTVTRLTENLDDVTQQKQTLEELKDKLVGYLVTAVFIISV